MNRSRRNQAAKSTGRPRQRDRNTQMHRAAMWSLVVLGMGTPGMAVSQNVEGRVIDIDLGLGIPQVVVEVQRGEEIVARAETDSDGGFSIELRQAGRYIIRTSATGYRGTESEGLDIRAREVVEVTIRLTRSAIAIEGITVEARRRDLRHAATYDGLYARRKAARSVGGERVVVRGDHQLENAIRVSDVLRWFVTGRGCVDYYVNGEPRPQEAWGILEMPAEFVEGIEYYRDGRFAPMDYYGGSCASRALSYSVVAVWYRRPGR
jgi:hypothetical protein